mmetsp:Transcript_52444/g.60261  ORF Transcript_52444/g.60261 Transcript_52444/m.60261 type:complete len:111 (-) Transcript_52444:1282-1614(-)
MQAACESAEVVTLPPSFAGKDFWKAYCLQREMIGQQPTLSVCRRLRMRRRRASEAPLQEGSKDEAPRRQHEEIQMEMRVAVVHAVEEQQVEMARSLGPFWPLVQHFSISR